MNISLIYEKMCKLTFFSKHLQPQFVKHLRKYSLVCVCNGRNLDRWHSNNACITKTFIVKYVSLVMRKL